MCRQAQDTGEIITENDIGVIQKDLFDRKAHKAGAMDEKTTGCIWLG
jgi:hypothetical protein